MIPQHRIHRFPVFLKDVLADDGRVYAGGMPHLFGDVHHLEMMVAAIILYIVVMTFPVMPESVVRSHDQRVRMQRPHNNLLNKLLIGHLGKIQRKGQHNSRINTLFINKFQVFIQTIDGKKRGFRMKYGARMGVKGQHHAGATYPCRLLAQETQNTGMTKMDAIKGANGHHRVFPFRQILYPFVD